MDIFVLFVYYITGTEPTYVYFRDDECWRDAAIVTEETGIPADCRTATMSTPVMLDTSSLYYVSPQTRPKARPEGLGQ